MNVDFIKVEQEDIESINKINILAKEIYNEYYAPMLSEDVVIILLYQSHTFDCVKKQIEDGMKYFIIKHENKEIGYFGYTLFTDYLYVNKLYILKDYRNKGIIHNAKNIILQVIKDNEYHNVRCLVNKKNKKTIDIYLNLGFKVIQETTNDIGQGFIMQDYLMEISV